MPKLHHFPFSRRACPRANNLSKQNAFFIVVPMNTAFAAQSITQCIAIRVMPKILKNLGPPPYPNPAYAYNIYIQNMYYSLRKHDDITETDEVNREDVRKLNMKL